MIDSAFAQPQKLLDRADRALNEAHRILSGFFNPLNIARVIEHDPATGDNVAKIKQLRPLPDAAEEHATNALNNLRNAFDQMLFAACGAIGKPLSDGHYPWADSPTQLDEWKLWNKKKAKETIPSELWDTIRAQQPYPRSDGYEGGHTLERAVATLANQKHTVGCEVSAIVANYTFNAVFTGETSLFSPNWDAEKNEMIVGRWKGEGSHFDNNYGVQFQVLFKPPVPSDLVDVPVVDALKAFSQFAHVCLDGFKARCVELGIA